MEEKYTILWKEEYKNETDELLKHKRRYLFLLELFLACVKKKNFVDFDKRREVTEYIEFAKNDFFLDFDKKFLEAGFNNKSGKYKKELAKTYFKKVHVPKCNFSIWATILACISPLFIILDFFYFCVKKDLLLVPLSAGIAFFLAAVVFKLYSLGKFNFNRFIYTMIMKPSVFLKNLDIEMKEIEEIQKSCNTLELNDSVSAGTKSDTDSTYPSLQGLNDSISTGTKSLSDNETYQKLCRLSPDMEIIFDELINKDFLFYDGSFIEINKTMFPEYCIRVLAHEESITKLTFRMIHPYFKKLFDYENINKISLPEKINQEAWNLTIFPLLNKLINSDKN